MVRTICRIKGLPAKDNRERLAGRTDGSIVATDGITLHIRGIV